MAIKWIARRPRFSVHSDETYVRDLPARRDQIHPIGMVAIGFCTGASFANKWIARRPRFSAHSDDTHSKDLPERPVKIHPDPRAAQRDAVGMIAYRTVNNFGKHGGMSGRPRASVSSVARRRRNELATHSDENRFEQGRPGDADEGVRGGWPPRPRPLSGGKGGVRGEVPGAVRGGAPPPPRAPGGGVGGSLRKGRLPPGRLFAGWGGFGGEGGLPAGHRVTGLRENMGKAAFPRATGWRGDGVGGVRGGGPPSPQPPRGQVAGWRGSEGGSRVPSGRRVVGWGCPENGQCASFKSGLAEPTRVLLSPFKNCARWATCLSVCLSSPLMGCPRSGSAHGLHWQTNGLCNGPEIQRISLTNILRPACTPSSNKSQWDSLDRVLHRGYSGRQMDCASAQIFGAFRRVGGPGGRAATPPASQSAPQSSVLRTENTVFSLSNCSRF